jgi:hypothetical protein
MLNRLLNNTGDDEEFGIQDTAHRVSRGYVFRWWHVLIALIIIFPYISVLVLFGLVGNQKNSGNTNNVSESFILFSFISFLSHISSPYFSIM